MNKLNILTISTLYPNTLQPYLGSFVRERIRAINKFVNVKVIAPIPYYLPTIFNKKLGKIPEREIDNGLEIYHPRFYKFPRYFKWSDGHLFCWALRNTLSNINRTYNFDIIDAHVAYPEGFGAVLLARQFKKKVCITVRGHDINIFAKHYYKKHFIKYALRKTDKVISVSDDLKKKVVDLGISSEKVKTIPNGVNLQKFFHIDPQKARKELHLPLEKKILLSIGNIIPLKGFEYLIKATSILRKEFRNIHLIIIGDSNDNNYKAKLSSIISEKRINDNIIFKGYVPNNELYKWYNAADLFCLASSSEGWPNVLLESLRCGTPVVASPVGGIPEIIDSNNLGYLVKKRDVESFAMAINKALNKKWDSTNLINYATENSWENTAKKAVDVFGGI